MNATLTEEDVMRTVLIHLVAIIANVELALH